jgi:hypothetical protein
MRLEGGGWKPEGGGWKPEGGGWKPEGGGWKPEGGGLKPEGGNHHLEFRFFPPGRQCRLLPLGLYVSP